jgi:lipopolysaccharide biosynthesis glycosyltransferase
MRVILIFFVFIWFMPHWSSSLISFILVLKCKAEFWQLFPDLERVVFLDDDVVVQKDLSELWDMDLHGMVNGAVETCHGDDTSVMSKTFKNYFNFSHPIIASIFDPKKCAWAYGMNVFDLQAWRKADITRVYHYWQKQVWFSSEWIRSHAHVCFEHLG